MKQKKETTESVAREKVENRFGLLNHFVVYIIVNGFMLGFDHFFTTKADWSYIPLFGWGIGLFIHALFVVFDEFAGNWKERMIKSEVEKLKKKL
ncbi:2TM domain-containing protein [Patescibacteria group bacterium]